jgi:hypothetical protein
MLTVKSHSTVVASGIPRPFTAVATKPMVVNFTLWHGLQLYNKFNLFEIRHSLSYKDKFQGA